MKFVLVNKYDEIVSRVDLGEVGVVGRKNLFQRCEEKCLMIKILISCGR